MVDDALLDATELSVEAGGVTLMSHLDLHVATGEFVALLGPSGCGKTTLLRGLAGLIDLPSGEVRFRGEDRGKLGWPRFRRQVLLVQQRPSLLDSSVEANLRRPFEYGAADGEFPRDVAIELLESLILSASVMPQNARALSIGEQQRVCLVRALLIRPAMLLMDEPTSALDSRARDAVEALLRRIVEEHEMAGLVVLHDEQQARRLCQRTIDLGPYLADRHKVSEAAAPGASA